MQNCAFVFRTDLGSVFAETVFVIARVLVHIAVCRIRALHDLVLASHGLPALGLLSRRQNIIVNLVHVGLRDLHLIRWRLLLVVLQDLYMALRLHILLREVLVLLAVFLGIVL